MTTPRPWVWTELVCRTCNNTTSGQFFRGTMKRSDADMMVREAKRNKWVFKHGELFCKPACVTLYESENPPPEAFK